MKKLAEKFTFYDIISLFLILACFAAGLILMQYMPPQVPTHWNIEGEIDGWSSPDVMIYWIPLFYIGIYLLLSLMPLIDPKRNYDKFIKFYSLMKLVIILFLTIIHGIMLCAAMGISVDMSTIVPSMIGVLFIVIGSLSPKIKQNYYVGFRTPWAIESPVVWEKTQKMGGICFVVCGIFMTVFSLLQLHYATLVAIVPAVIVPLVYSYMVYRKEREQA